MMDSWLNLYTQSSAVGYRAKRRAIAGARTEVFVRRTSCWLNGCLQVEAGGLEAARASLRFGDSSGAG